MFLRVDENKTELFLAHCIHELPITDKQILTTFKTEILCNSNLPQSNLSPCSHEEADARMILHLADAAKAGYNRILVRTVDTDVVVLAVCYYYTVPASEIWITFGTGKHLRYIGVGGVGGGLTSLQKHSALKNHQYCPYSMRLQAETQCQHFMEKARNQHGMRGWLMTN